MATILSIFFFIILFLLPVLVAWFVISEFLDYTLKDLLSLMQKPCSTCVYQKKVDKYTYAKLACTCPKALLHVEKLNPDKGIVESLPVEEVRGTMRCKYKKNNS